jgi:hypothetical protein
MQPLILSAPDDSPHASPMEEVHEQSDLIKNPHLAEDDQYQMEAILGQKEVTNKNNTSETLLEIKWVGWSLANTTWETLSKVQSDLNFASMWKDYQERLSRNKRYRAPRHLET